MLGSFYCYIADYQSNFFVDRYIYYRFIFVLFEFLIFLKS